MKMHNALIACQQNSSSISHNVNGEKHLGFERVMAERLPLIYDGGTNQMCGIVVTDAHIVIDE